MSERSIRVLIQKASAIVDETWEVELSEFGGILPNVGDIIADMQPTATHLYEVTQRVFEIGPGSGYWALVVKSASAPHIKALARYS